VQADVLVQLTLTREFAGFLKPRHIGHYCCAGDYALFKRFQNRSIYLVRRAVVISIHNYYS
jgi:hypothetical protein